MCFTEILLDQFLYSNLTKKRITTTRLIFCSPKLNMCLSYEICLLESQNDRISYDNGGGGRC